MSYKFSNRASALLASAITPASNTLTLTSGGGALFPFLGPEDICQAAIISSAGATEYVTITQIVGNTLTVQRAKEGTAAQSFASGSRVECRVTAAVLNSFLPKNGGVLEGDLDFSDQYNIKNLKGFTPPAIVLNAIHASLLRAEDVDKDANYDPNGENAIVIPTNNGDITNRGRRILHTGFFDGIIFTAYIDINNIPPHFKLCDGTNGTPDLRGRFLRGWDLPRSDGYPGHVVGEIGGADGAFTSNAGRHAHTGKTSDTTMDASNLPSLQVTIANQPTGGEVGGSFRVTGVTVSYSGGRAHYHFIGEEPDHRHAVDTVPAFMTIAYVMFNGP